MITYQSLAAEAETRYHAEPSRLLKAVEIATKGTTNIFNTRCPDGSYDVRSQSALNAWYRVDTKAHTCTCKDSQRGHACKHRLAVWLYTEQIKRTRAQVAAQAAQSKAPTMIEIKTKNDAWHSSIIAQRRAAGLA